MAKGNTDKVVAMLDTIMFASKDNPISEIPLRVGRGNSLKNPANDEFVEDEDNNLPVIVGGANASGKTSMLRGINEICKLLQKSIIDDESNRKVWNKLNDIGISHLELQFAVVIGRTDIRGGNLWSRLHLADKIDEIEKLPFKCYTEDFESPAEIERGYNRNTNGEIVIENLIQIKMDNSSDNKLFLWRDGLRARRIGGKNEISKMYPNYAELREGKVPGKFRNIKSQRAVEKFLNDDVKYQDLDGMMLTDFEFNKDCLSDFHSLKFQNSKMITVNREDSEQEIEKLRNLIPKITKKYQKWLAEPEVLREQLLARMENNQLFTDLNLKTPDIVYTDQRIPGYFLLHGWAPDIIENLMMKPENVSTYTWFGDYAWKNKQDAIDFVMEGCVHDIVNFLTDTRNKKRIITGSSIGKKLEGDDFKEVKWIDAPQDFSITKLRSLVPDYVEFGYNKEIYKIHEMPTLSQVLKELPFIAGLLGMSKKDTKVIDILVRFNAFTPIEDFKQPYMSSGQKQVLALITAVRNAPEGALILVDEPEISLHVNWQERLVEQLYAPLVGSRLLIATHSPDIVINHRHLCTTLLVNEGGEFYR